MSTAAFLTYDFAAASATVTGIPDLVSFWDFREPEGSPRTDHGPHGYLMCGYDSKSLTLSHDSNQAVTFTVEVDFYGDGQWHEYQRLFVGQGNPLTMCFPKASPHIGCE